MAQRRNSSGRGDERSDLDDTKALAAKARSTTGGPIVAPNPAELSGVRPRRDSVIGARLTPPPRQTGGELPNWFFGALGFLTVLLVGFAGLFVLGRSGKLDALLGEGSPTIATAPSPAPAAPAAAPAPAAAAEPVPAAPPPAAERAAEPAHGAAHHAAAPAPADEPPPARAPAAEKAAEKAPEAEPARPAEEPAAHASKPAHEHVAAAAPAKPHAGKPADPGTAEPGEGEADEAPAAAPKPARAAAPAKAEADEADDDQSAPGQDAVEAALDALSSKVRGCFVKYQIKGTARVRLVATPGGSAESVNVTGEFEDTPTGLCVEGVVSSAKLPTFKGPPLKLSQSYQLR